MTIRDEGQTDVPEGQFHHAPQGAAAVVLAPAVGVPEMPLGVSVERVPLPDGVRIEDMAQRAFGVGVTG